jgi:hypothetical protein
MGTEYPSIGLAIEPTGEAVYRHTLLGCESAHLYLYY